MNIDEIKTLRVEPDARGFKSHRLRESEHQSIAEQIAAFEAAGGKIQLCGNQTIPLEQETQISKLFSLGDEIFPRRQS